MSVTPARRVLSKLKVRRLINVLSSASALGHGRFCMRAAWLLARRLCPVPLLSLTLAILEPLDVILHVPGYGVDVEVVAIAQRQLHLHR